MKLFDLVKALDANPRVDVTSDEVYAGEKAEETLSAEMLNVYAELPFLEEFDLGRVLSFYSQCNGCNIQWVEKDKEDPERGAIRILPFESAILYSQNFIPDEPEFMDCAWGVDFEGTEYETRRPFAERLLFFDDYAETSGMALVFSRPPEPKLMMIGNAYTELDCSRLIDFDSYFHFLLASRGAFRSRYATFNEYRGDKQPVMRFDETPCSEVEPAIFRAS